MNDAIANLYVVHHDNDEVKPAPGVGEVLDKAKGKPLDHHLHGKYHSEDTVHVVEDVLQHWTILKTAKMMVLTKKEGLQILIIKRYRLI